MTLPREKHTERLVRILTTIDTGRTPIPVKKLPVWSTSGTHLVLIGKPYLWQVVHHLRTHPRLKRVAIILHIRRDEPNEVLVFERGQNWRREQIDERLREKWM